MRPFSFSTVRQPGSSHGLERTRPAYFSKASAGLSFQSFPITGFSAAIGASGCSFPTRITNSTATSPARPARARVSRRWGYCLTPNHVHFILTPKTPEGVGRALGKA